MHLTDNPTFFLGDMLRETQLTIMLRMGSDRENVRAARSSGHRKGSGGALGRASPIHLEKIAPKEPPPSDIDLALHACYD